MVSIRLMAVNGRLRGGADRVARAVVTQGRRRRLTGGCDRRTSRKGKQLESRAAASAPADPPRTNGAVSSPSPLRGGSTGAKRRAGWGPRATLHRSPFCFSRRRSASPRRLAPELYITSALEIRWRAQGRPDAGRARGPPAKKMQAAGTTGLAEHARPSLRNGWNGLYVVSLVHRACWPPCATTRFRTPPQDTSVGVSGPHDFAVRNKPFVGAT